MSTSIHRETVERCEFESLCHKKSCDMDVEDSWSAKPEDMQDFFRLYCC
ncbi:unnamed protein product [Amoebophrya sp. A25]|nr:unnamed protein product [Amoebophrya sp. A25]|eukprot:GSA25T00013416001.1